VGERMKNIVEMFPRPNTCNYNGYACVSPNKLLTQSKTQIKQLCVLGAIVFAQDSWRVVFLFLCCVLSVSVYCLVVFFDVASMPVTEIAHHERSVSSFRAVHLCKNTAPIIPSLETHNRLGDGLYSLVTLATTNLSTKSCFCPEVLSLRTVLTKGPICHFQAKTSPPPPLTTETILPASQ
jgi:hypothetical protein